MLSHSADKLLLLLVGVCVAGGFLILASASMVISYKQFGTASFYILRQFLYGGILGGMSFAATQWIPYRFWRKAALPLMIVSFILMALLFIPEISYVAGGARRWLKIGSFSFQPSEFLKLAFVIYLASWLDARRKEVGSISYGMAPFSLMLGIVGIFLAMQPDIGTLGVIVATAGMLYFLGGGRISQIIMLVALGLTAFFFLVQLAPYRMERVMVFLHPGSDPRGSGYQITQATIAIGSGGFLGQGFGRSLQKYSYLPEPTGDSIFAVFAEEMGFLGAAVLVGLLGVLFWRGLSIAKRAPDSFGKLLAAGIALNVMIQAFINMAAISGMLPLTGIPLPFVSYGSTSLVVTLSAMGILVNVSKYT